jgi:hypothetical protein
MVRLTICAIARVHYSCMRVVRFLTSKHNSPVAARPRFGAAAAALPTIPPEHFVYIRQYSTIRARRGAGVRSAPFRSVPLRSAPFRSYSALFFRATDAVSTRDKI